MNRCRQYRGIEMEVQVTGRSFKGLSMTVVSPDFVEQTFLRRRGSEAIDRLGTPIQILREGSVIALSRAILSPLQKISSPKTLSIIREAWFKADDDIQGGDYVFDMNRSIYFLYLAQNEYISEGEIVGIASIVAKCNHVISIYRNVEKPSGYGGVKSSFEEIGRDIPVSIEFIKGGVRETEPGFFKQSTHRIFTPSFYGISEMDRIKVGENYLRIDAVDTISFPNVRYCTGTRDERPNESR